MLRFFLRGNDGVTLRNVIINMCMLSWDVTAITPGRLFSIARLILYLFFHFCRLKETLLQTTIIYILYVGIMIS